MNKCYRYTLPIKEGMCEREQSQTELLENEQSSADFAVVEIRPQNLIIRKPTL